MSRAVLLILLALLLVSCAQPAYTPPEQTLAEREAAEYATRIDRGTWAWRIGLAFVIILLSILSGLVYFLATVRYRVAAAEAKRKEGEARRALLVQLGEGAVLDLQDNTIRTTPFKSSTVSEVIPAMRPAPLPAQKNGGDSIQKFVIEAAAIVSWNSETLPRWERWREKGYAMTSAEWMQRTGVLVEMGLIDKSQGRETTIVDGDLRWLYEQLTSPTPAGQLF